MVLSAYEPIANAPLNEIGKQLSEDFKSWRSKQGVGIHTVNSSLRVLRAVLHRATLEDLRRGLVKGEVTILPGAKSREHVVTFEEEEAYSKVCTEPLKSIASIMLATGFRPEEVFRLKWECINFEGTGGRIFNEHGKSNAARRSVSMTQRVYGILTERWKAAGEPPFGWVFPAQKASVGHVVPDTIYNRTLTP